VPTAKSKAADPSQSGSADDSNSQDPGFLGNSGPGTGQDAGAESAPRMPTQQVVHAESGPLNPDDAKMQVQPEHGYADSSTNPTYAAAGGRTIAGEDHVQLVGSDGKKISGELFSDDNPDSPFVTVKQTVEEQFTYANAPDHPVTRLLFSEGQRVARSRAAGIKAAALDAKQEPTFEGQRGQQDKGTRQGSGNAKATDAATKG